MARSFDNIPHSDALSLHNLVNDSEILAEAMIDTVRNCLLILSEDLCVRVANRSFFLSFGVTPKETIGRLLFELGDGQWDIPELRRLLQGVPPQDSSFRDFAVTYDFPHLGSKSMLLDARRLRNRAGGSHLILLAIEDVTERKRLEREVLAQMVKQELLIAEVHHRVKNNLQAVVSLLNLQVNHATDPHVVEALSEAAERVRAIARLHETLYTSSDLTEINFGEYLRYLAAELQTVHGRPEISFEVEADGCRHRHGNSRSSRTHRQ